MADDPQLRAKINSVLVESPEYSLIQASLENKLVECGWWKEMQDLATEQLEELHNGSNFNKTVETIQPIAVEKVPLTIRQDIQERISKLLEELLQDLEASK